MDSETAKIIENLKKFKKRLKFEVDKIIFFGSRTKGTYNKHSDVDLIVISKHFKNQKFRHRSIELYDYWDLKYPVDFICYTPDEFKEKSTMITLARTAKQEGVVI